MALEPINQMADAPRAGLAIVLAAALAVQLGCATSQTEAPESPKLSAEECEGIGALLIDPEFETVGEAGSVWLYKQHTGEMSFSAVAGDGQLDFARIGDEPWAIIRQKITDPRLSGRVVRYSAELKGDVSEEITHAFGAKSGLFLRLGPRPDANMADHEPNIGQWAWQRVAVEAELPEAFDYVEVGFIYQGGDGLMSAKNPVFELAECSP